mgnify:CR=1 FL=1
MRINSIFSKNITYVEHDKSGMNMLEEFISNYKYKSYIYNVKEKIKKICKDY